MPREPRPGVRDRHRGDPVGAAVRRDRRSCAPTRRTRCATRTSSYGEHPRATARPGGSCCSSSGLAERQDDRVERVEGPGGQGRVRRRRGTRRRRPRASRAAGRRRRATSCASEDASGEYVYAVVERDGRAGERRCCPDCSRGLVARHRLAEVAALGRRARRASSGRCAGCSRSSARTSCRCEFAGLDGRARHVRPSLPRAGADRGALGAASTRSPAERGTFVLDHEERARLIREGIAARAAQRRRRRGRAREDVRRGREPRGVADRRRRPLRRGLPARCRARCSRPRWSRTSATSRCEAADGCCSTRSSSCTTATPTARTRSSPDTSASSARASPTRRSSTTRT